MPKGRTVRCKRCKTNTGNSLELDGWGFQVKDGNILGYICPACLKPGEASPLPEGATLDIGHGYEDDGAHIKGNFRFLKKLIEGPEYYGKREAMMDWETFSDMLRRAMEQIKPERGLSMELEIQTLWNFKLTVSPVTNGTRIISSTGYHTHGMKKGKQLDENLIRNLLGMGMTQPSGDVREWSIQLTSEECAPHHLNKIMIHILERGYEFNPNLIQSVEFDEVK